MSLAGQHTKGEQSIPYHAIERPFGCHIHSGTFRIINLEETDQPSLYKKYDLSWSSNRYAKLMFNLLNRVPSTGIHRTAKHLLRSYGTEMVWNEYEQMIRRWGDKITCWISRMTAYSKWQTFVFWWCPRAFNFINVDV